jgi:hypothetical protein
MLAAAATHRHAAAMADLYITAGLPAIWIIVALVTGQLGHRLWLSEFGSRLGIAGVGSVVVRWDLDEQRRNAGD